MQSLVDTLASPKNNVLVDIILSQDGYLTVLDGVMNEMKKRSATVFLLSSSRTSTTRQENRPGDSGYHKLSRHFGWFLGQVFDEQRYEQVIILEVLMLLPDHAGRSSRSLPISSPTSTPPRHCSGKTPLSTA